MILTQAPGKMILLGEYAVLRGAPALVTAVDRRACAELTPADEESFELISTDEMIGTVSLNRSEVNEPGAGPDPHSKIGKFSFILSALSLCLKGEDTGSGGFSVRLDTEDFYDRSAGAKYGFGSSAALTVAFLMAVRKWQGRPVSREELFRDAYAAHYGAQGQSGSGIDIAASVWGGTLKFRSGSSPVEMGSPEGLHLLALWTGRPASTRDMIAGVDRMGRERPDLYREFYDSLNRLSSEGARAYGSGDIRRFLIVIGEWYEVLDRFSQRSGIQICTPEHRDLERIARSAGAVYKPSGAGGGDLGIAFCTGEEQLREVRSRAEQSGYRILPMKTGAPAAGMVI